MCGVNSCCRDYWEGTLVSLKRLDFYANTPRVVNTKAVPGDSEVLTAAKARVHTLEMQLARAKRQVKLLQDAAYNP